MTLSTVSATTITYASAIHLQISRSFSLSLSRLQNCLCLISYQSEREFK